MSSLQTNAINTAGISVITAASPFALLSNLGTTNASNVGICVAAPTGTTLRTIKIGNSTADSVHIGSLDISVDGIESQTPAVGDIDLGISQTAVGAVLRIGTNTNRLGPISLGCCTAGGTSSHTTSIATESTGLISIGRSTGGAQQTTVNGKLTSSALLTASSGLTIPLGQKMICNTIETTATNQSGALFTNITNPANVISIGNSTGGAVQIECNAMTIRNGGNGLDVATAGTFNLGVFTANNVSIGKTATGTTTINNALTSTGLITASGNLAVLGTTTTGTACTLQSAITLNTGYIATPTAKTQLGCLITEANTTNTTSTNVLSSGAMTNIAFYNIGIGTWIISASYSPNIASTPASVSNQQLILSTTSASGSGYRAIASETIVVAIPSLVPFFCVSTVISSTSSLTNIYLEYQITYVGGSIQVGTNYVFTATRIA